jgi:hypothetical protein
MAQESKGVALAILGIVAVIAVVGLVLLFSGAAAKVSLGRGEFITPTGDKACSVVSCQNGYGAIVLGEQLHADGEYWVCGCPNHFSDADIADWSNQWSGDENRHGTEFNDYDLVLLVRKIREY